jgi:hypothetical protein
VPYTMQVLVTASGTCCWYLVAGTWYLGAPVGCDGGHPAAESANVLHPVMLCRCSFYQVPGTSNQVP